MTDSQHLAWIVGRLINVHGENPSVDYMIRLQEIVKKLNSPPKADSETKEWPQVGDEFIHKGKLVTCISKGVTGKGDEVITYEGEDKLSHGSCWNNDSWVKKPKTEAEILRDEIETTIINELKAENFTGDLGLGDIASIIHTTLDCNFSITKKPQ